MSSGEKFMPRKKARTIEAAIPYQTLEDLISAHLYAISYVNNDEDITSVEFPKTIDRSSPVAIKFTIKKEGRKTT